MGLKYRPESDEVIDMSSIAFAIWYAHVTQALAWYEADNARLEQLLAP